MNVDNWEQFKKLVESVKKTIAQVKADNDKKPGTMGVLSFFKEKDEISHSKTIAFLLNPEGQHKKNDEFLKEFIEAVGPLPHISGKDLTSCEVQREEKDIDIFIEHKDFCIILENKKPGYGYKDQPNQLARYYNTALEKGYSEDKIYILYLTIDGSSPSNTSTECGSLQLNEKAETKIDEDNNNKVINPSNGIINISYEEHILEWLETIEKSCSDDESLLKSGIMQYRYLIEILTNQTEEEEDMNKKIKETLRKELNDDPELCNLLKQITEVFLELEKEEEEKKIIQNVKAIKKQLEQPEQCSIIEEGHQVVIMSEQTPIDEGDIDTIDTIKCLGVGITIIKDKLTLAIESEGGKYNFGLMAHRTQHNDIKEKLNKLDIQLKEDKYWYEHNYISLDTKVEELFDMMISKYKKVKHIK